MDKPEPAQHEAALEWFVRLRDAELSSEDRDAFATWLRADPRHAAAYREAETLWAALDQLDAETEASPTPPLEAPLDVEAAPLPARPARPANRLWHLAQAAAVAAVALLAAYTLAGPDPVGALLADYSTAVGARESHRLADGSTVELNGATAVSVDFAPGERKVTLRSGEAFFQVAKDASRPFVVDTALGRITALGTGFAVKIGDGFVDVTVAESRVAVAHAVGGRTELAAGQQLRLGRDHLGAVTTPAGVHALAWRDGKLVFRNTPLNEVIDELERQRPGRIELMDARLRDLKVTGAFNLEAGGAAAGDKVLNAIAGAFPVRLVRVTDYVVLIFPRTPG